MTVDTYAICPCGSGKKIKFCKCKESVGEMDRVMKMVEGGQLVPAMDRLAAILNEHPDAAWALAVRGRLFLNLREYDSLAENADRFIRLQPSNPLALTQRAAAQLFRGDVPAATESMLEALTESGQDVDVFVLDVASVLAVSLVQSGVYLTARVYATLAMMASGYEEGGQAAVSVLRQLNSSPQVNQFVKSIPEPVQRPADAEWGERYDEAIGLLRSNKVVLAQSKFESLQRVASGQPSILSGLLTCAIWRGETDAQSDFLLKLSNCDSLDFQQRVRYRAMSALVQPGTPQLSVPVAKLSCDIDDAEQVEMAMTADARFVPFPAEMLAQMRTSEDDVPPRSGFQILDRDKPESMEQLPPVEAVPEAIAMVFVYGKQTDRAARVEVVDVRASDVEEVRNQIQRAVGDLQLNEEAGDPLPLLVASQPPVAMIRFHAKPAEAEVLQSELAAQRMPKLIASLKLPILEGNSLADLADDESKLLVRTTVVRIVEQFDVISSKGDQIVPETYRLAGIDLPSSITLEKEQMETVPNEDLWRIDASTLDAESAMYLLQRAQQVSSTFAVRRFADRLIELPLEQDQLPAKLLAYASLVNASPTSSQALETLQQAKAFAESNNLSTANLLLSEVSLRLQAGDGQGFQNTLEALTSRYGNEPEVMAQLQQMLMAYGLIRPDGSPTIPPAPAEAAVGVDPMPATGNESALWTPDGGQPVAPQQGAGGEKKLWIPGMD